MNYDKGNRFAQQDWCFAKKKKKIPRPGLMQVKEEKCTGNDKLPGQTLKQLDCIKVLLGTLKTRYIVDLCMLINLMLVKNKYKYNKSIYGSKKRAN